MKNLSTHTGTLEIIKRLPSSINGNSRYLARCGGFTFRTAVDSGWTAYLVNLDGKEATVTLGTHYGVCTLASIEEVRS